MPGRRTCYLEEYAQALWQDTGPFDLIHVHDWLVAFVGIALKQQLQGPAAEHHPRHRAGTGAGHLGSDQARAIHQVEWWLAFESWRVIACSDYMVDEIADYFHCPRDKIDVIPNGVDPTRFDLLEGKDLADFRNMYALPSETRLCFTWAGWCLKRGCRCWCGPCPWCWPSTHGQGRRRRQGTRTGGAALPGLEPGRGGKGAVYRLYL